MKNHEKSLIFVAFSVIFRLPQPPVGGAASGFRATASGISKIIEKAMKIIDFRRILTENRRFSMEIQ